MEDGSELHDLPTIKRNIKDFFSGLFKDEDPIYVWLYGGAFPNFSKEDLALIQNDPLNEESKSVVFSIRALKALGPDDLNPLFFLSQWDTVRSPIFLRVKEALLNLSSIKLLNHMNLILILKVV